eukprot:14186881-Heterocapsa_arctica.AAC.1
MIVRHYPPGLQKMLPGGADQSHGTAVKVHGFQRKCVDQLLDAGLTPERAVARPFKAHCAAARADVDRKLAK